MNIEQKVWVRGFFATILVVCVSHVVPAQQAIMQFPVERETSIDGWDNHDGYGDPPVYDKFLETEEWTNFGGSLAIRARKSTQHAGIIDWNTDAINAFLAANADPNQPMEWSLNVYPINSPPSFDVTIETIESLNDWAEGNGGAYDADDNGALDDEYVNFNWEPGTKAVTTNFAQTAFMLDDDGDRVLDLDNSVPWIDNDTGTGGIDDNQYGVLGRADNWSPGLPLPDFVNTELLFAVDLDDALSNATYASVPLDLDLVNAILTDPNNRGIIFGPLNGAANDNWEIATRENDGFGGQATELPGPLAAFLEVTYTPRSTPNGDFDNSGALDLGDINDLTTQVASGNNPARYDLNGDSLVDDADVRVWIKDLFGSWIGDANLDGEFNSADFVAVFQAQKFEIDTDAGWDQGDWTGDRRFNSTDFVAAFQDQGFEMGPRMAAVPEPGALALLTIGLLAGTGLARRHGREAIGR